jgi:hypothetical protein
MRTVIRPKIVWNRTKKNEGAVTRPKNITGTGIGPKKKQ